jgi:hypothetical protein
LAKLIVIVDDQQAKARWRRSTHEIGPWSRIGSEVASLYHSWFVKILVCSNRFNNKRNHTGRGVVSGFADRAGGVKVLQRIPGADRRANVNVPG